MTSESDIIHESACQRFFVLRERRRGKPVYLVCENRAAGGSLVRGTYAGERFRAAAIENCDARALPRGRDRQESTMLAALRARPDDCQRILAFYD